MRYRQSWLVINFYNTSQLQSKIQVEILERDKVEAKKVHTHNLPRKEGNCKRYTAEICSWWAVWPDWAIFWTLVSFSKPLAPFKLTKFPTVLWNFCKGVIFLLKSVLGNFYRHLAINSGHTVCERKSKSAFKTPKIWKEATTSCWKSSWC